MTEERPWTLDSVLDFGVFKGETLKKAIDTYPPYAYSFAHRLNDDAETYLKARMEEFIKNSY
jgi:hypothetical protein